MLHASASLCLCLLAFSKLTVIDGFPEGAPRTACQSMTPVHGVGPQTNPSPYRVTFALPSTGSYDSVRQIEVNISSPTGATFKGFLLTAISASGSTPGRQVGSFATPRQMSSKLECNRKAVTHSFNRARRDITAVWIPPTTPEGPIVFSATIVEKYSKFWTGVQSDRLEATVRP